MSPQRAKVVVVEDDEFVLEDALKSLTESGHRLLFQASDVVTARKLLENLKETPDVALIDSRFPNGPGEITEDEKAGGIVASTIKNRFPEATIVMFSNRSNQEFGTHRFPGPGESKLGRIEDLGQFISSLPAPARK
ncbi:hypothetical protein HY407_00085 [Candidatus Gottesmanbacteria bacterium]|nr:hypothetical protein [Candidatus Gottesmanbacteria bacterium]